MIHMHMHTHGAQQGQEPRQGGRPGTGSGQSIRHTSIKVSHQRATPSERSCPHGLGTHDSCG